MIAHDSWSKHQNRCLHEYQRVTQLGVKDVRVAFPGSLLFNQLLLVDVSRRFACEPVTLSSLDVVFRYCGLTASVVERKELLVVCDNEDALPSIDCCIDQIQGFDAISVLSCAPDKIVQHLSREYPHTSVNASHIEWDNIDALYKRYREAKHCVFVDTMCVMDAAFTGCACTLIASDEFRRNLGFEYLQWNLQKVECEVIDTQGAVLNPVTADRFPFLVAENSAMDIERQMAIFVEKRPKSELYTNSILGPALPGPAQSNSADEVITSPKQSIHDPLVRLRTRKRKFTRKVAKLRQDPRAFLEDSDNVLLKILAKLLPINRRG